MSRPRYWLAGTLTACCLALAANAQVVSQVVNTVAISTGVTGLGTSVATALGVNVGSAGAILVKGTSVCADLSNGATGCSTVHTELPWTPTLIGSTSGSWTLSAAVGTYEKSGNQLTVRFYVAASAASSPVGNIQIGGLPAASNSTSNDWGICTINNQTALTNTAGYTTFTGRVAPATSVIAVLESGSGQITNLADVSKAGATVSIMGMCSYHS